MVTTISYAGGTITPDAVPSYTSTRPAGNIVHPLLGRAAPDITLRPAQLRAGTLDFMFTSETASKLAEDAHATGAVFTLASDRTSIVMTYVVAGGSITRALNDSGSAWVLSVPFQEVAA